MSEKIAIFGTGYVGLVTGVCLARVGNNVTCVDIDEKKIALLQKGECPIYEPRLQEYMSEMIELGRLTFTINADVAVKDNDIIMIAVGTPPDEDGSADLRHVLNVATTIGKHLNMMYGDDQYDVVAGADALIILTEWPRFRAPDLANIRTQLKMPIIFDARNLLEPADVVGAGIGYVSIGRRDVFP